MQIKTRPPVRKVKVFTGYASRMADVINNFVEGKDVTDIDWSLSGKDEYVIATVYYLEDEDV